MHSWKMVRSLCQSVFISISEEAHICKTDRLGEVLYSSLAIEGKSKTLGVYLDTCSIQASNDYEFGI